MSGAGCLLLLIQAVPLSAHPHRWIAITLGLLFLALIVFLSVLLGIRRPGRLRLLYRAYFRSAQGERLFLASVSFFLTFALIRIITHAIHNKWGPFHDVSVKGRHIHHLVWGILLLLSAGYGWMVKKESNHGLTRLLTIAYGVGAALTLDEFALWLNLRDVYWEREGRESVDITLLYGALLSIGLWGGPFVRAVMKELAHPGSAVHVKAASAGASPEVRQK